MADLRSEGVTDYVALVRQFNDDGKLHQYPGSPAIAHMLLRAQDQLRLFELHPTDHRILASYLGTVKGAEVYDTDGFGGLKGQVPPSSRRAVVLMDPSYEGHGDYRRVVAALREAREPVARTDLDIVWHDEAQLNRALVGLIADGLVVNVGSTQDHKAEAYSLPE